MDDTATVDLFVIGGGINGTGIARDAAGRGLSVVLCEKDDLAEGTSSRSGKLIHGGLRYLEYYEFRLVREALIEREVLLASAPHIIWPMRFVLPHSAQDRPAWLIRLGLFLYDHLGGRKKLPPTRVVNLHQASEGMPLKDQYRKGFEYSDCWVDDARLVVLNALDAQRHGATVLTRTRVQSARRVGDHWRIQVMDNQSRVQEYRARALVNAAGPWVNRVINTIEGARTSRNVRLVKGSHIVVRKFWQGDQAYLLQNADKRVIFVNPYLKNYALIGTTDIPHEGDPESVVVDENEIHYLIGTVNRYFKNALSADDVVQSYAGVRPLYDDASDSPSAVTRDYVFDVDATDKQAPLLSVFGGKITTFRKLAEHALNQLKPYFENPGEPWTASAVLPGGDIDDADFPAFLGTIQRNYPWLEHATCEHLVRAYGTQMSAVIGGATGIAELGERFAASFYEREALYLLEHEWAQTADDILYRRTKHGVYMTEVQRNRFVDWCTQRQRVSECDDSVQYDNTGHNPIDLLQPVSE